MLRLNPPKVRVWILPQASVLTAEVTLEQLKWQPKKLQSIMKLWRYEWMELPFPFPEESREETPKRPRSSDSQQVNCQQKVSGSKIFTI